MRILHVISGLGRGGAETFLAVLAPRLAERGFEQRVISLSGDGPLAARLDAAHIPLIKLDARRLLGLAQTAGALARAVADFKPDVLQGWMYHGDLFALGAHRLVPRRGRRLFWNIRCSDMNLADYSRQLRLVVRGCVRGSAIPDVVIANSEAGATAHINAGYRPRKLVVIPNGVDCDQFAPNAAHRLAVRSELGIGPDDTVAMHVARVDPMKDHQGLIAALSQIEGVRAVLAGTGTETLKLPDNAIGIGQRGDVARLLTAGDIIVSSSAYGEGFSNAIAEGMAAGLVPVATDVGDSRVIVGETGAVVPPRDPGKLAAALQAMIDLPVQRRSERGRSARARMLEHYTIEASVERYATLYREPMAAAAA